MRMAIFMQFWKGDQDEAAEAAKLMADVETCKREDVDFIFAYRTGAVVDWKTMDHVAQKFNQVIPFEGKKCEQGWPNGSNSLWARVIDWAYRMQRDQGAEWDVLLTIEPDVVPCRPDWLDALMKAWSHKQSDTIAMGHKYENGEDVARWEALPPEEKQRHPYPVASHINGNAMFHPNLAKEIPQISQGTPYNQSWDIYWATRGLMDRGEDTGLIVNQYKQQHATPEKLFKPRVKGVRLAYVHGYRDDTARKIVRERLEEWHGLANVK